MKPTLVSGLLPAAISCLVIGAANAQMPPRGKIDTNGDGVVDFSEMQAKRPDLTAEEFNRIDTNSDGQLAPDELHAAHAAKFMERLDKDGDGAVSQEEMEAFGPPHPPRGDAAAHFQEFDTNGDGKLTEEEFKAMGEAMGKRHKFVRKHVDHEQAEDDSN